MGEEENIRGNPTSPGRQECVPGQTSKSFLAFTELWVETETSTSGDPPHPRQSLHTRP